MRKPKKASVDRRNFLKSAGAAAFAGGAVAPQIAAQQPPVTASPQRSVTPLMTKEAESAMPASLDVLENQRPGSDFMVDVIKSLGFEYVCANPGSSFRGLHESIINYGGNKAPSSSPAATRNPRSRWRTATPRSKASRCWCWRMAPLGCSTPRWRFTTPTAIACRST